MEHRRESLGTQRGTRLPVPKSRIPYLGSTKNSVPLLAPTVSQSNNPVSAIPLSAAEGKRRPVLKPPSHSYGISMGPPGTPMSRHPVQRYNTPTVVREDSLSLSAVPDSVTTTSNSSGDLEIQNSISTIAPVIESTQLNDSSVVNAKERRRPRPSLSDRTIDTLSALSPSPARAVRRPSMTSNGARSPFRPSSSMSNSRPSTPSRTRAASPFKDVVARSNAAIPPVPRLSTISNNSRLLKSPQVVSKTIQREPLKIPKTGTGDTISRLPAPKSVRSSINPAGPVTGASTPRASMSSTAAVRSTSTVRPTSTNKSQSKKLTTEKSEMIDALNSPKSTSAIKSSVALREAIAAAKAARKPAKPLNNDGSKTSGKPSNFTSSDFDMPEVSARGLLQKRLEIAVTSGILNISTMSFSQIPDQVMKMYEPGSVSTPWSEMVDLVKLVAADNELSQIRSDAFPDFSLKELQEDDDKSNQFGGLEALDLHNNILTEVPIGLRRLEGLRILNLTNNKLTSDSLQVLCQIPSLTELYLAKNKLSGTFAISGDLPNLRILDVMENQLQQVDVGTLASLKTLQVLRLGHNQFSNLPWIEMSTIPLIELDISYNRVGGSLLAGSEVKFDRLKILDISHNTIDKLEENTSAAFPALHSLSASSNRIKVFPDLSLSCLHTLLLAENGLSTFPEWLSNIESLQRVDLGFNNITTVDMHVAKMENLTYLNLVGNPLRERKYLTMSTNELKADLEKKLMPLTSEVEAELMPDIISSRPGSPSKTGINVAKGILDLSSRNLHTISAQIVNIATNQPIHTINLARNRLQELPFELLSLSNVQSSLRSLDLSHNYALVAEHSKMSRPEPLSLPILTTLRITATGISNTSLTAFLTRQISAPNLQVLDVSGNNLTGSLPDLRGHLPQLTAVLAANNNFTVLPIASVHGLETLDIRNNEVAYLPPTIGLLGNLPNQSHQKNRLRLLECSGNKFRVPRLAIVEKGTEAVLRDLRRMIPQDEVSNEWRDYL